MSSQRSVRKHCRDVARLEGFDVYAAENVEQTLPLLETHPVDVALLELSIPSNSSRRVVQEVRRRRPEVEVIAITGYGNVRFMMHAKRLGIEHYLRRPFNRGELEVLFRRIAIHLENTKRGRQLQRIRSQQGLGPLLPDSPPMQKLYSAMARAASSNRPVLICGERGSGKEVVARWIQLLGHENDKPFIPLDCGSLDPQRFERALFGYISGTLSIPEGGIIFLDEVSELSSNLQRKLLQVLKGQRFGRGGKGTHRVSARLMLSATDLPGGERQRGGLRRDLFNFLDPLVIHVPPLRNRRSDIPLLVAHFVERLSHSTGVHRTLSEDALRLLTTYEWPGNVRELRDCLEQAWAQSRNSVIEVSDLGRESEAERILRGPRTIVPLDKLEKRAINTALTLCEGDTWMASRLLGMGHTTIKTRLQKYRRGEGPRDKT